MKKILIIEPEFKAKFVELDSSDVDRIGGVRLEALQKAVGGYIEHISTISFFSENGYLFFVNEEGKLLGLTPNPSATAISLSGAIGDWIAGKAVCIKQREDGVSTPLDEEDEKKIREWFSKNMPELRI